MAGVQCVNHTERMRRQSLPLDKSTSHDCLGKPLSERSEYYDAVTEQATLAEAGGLAKERSVLLLWFLRNVVGVGELEAYDHVCDGDNDKGIDGLFLERGAGEDSPDTLVVYQSKYTESPNSKVGPNDLDRLAGTFYHFQSGTSLDSLLRSGTESSLLQLIDTLDLPGALTDDSPGLQVRLVLVTTGTLNGDAQKKVAALREAHGNHYIEVWDVDSLGRIAVAVKSPERLQAEIRVQIEPDVLITGESPNRVAVLPVCAEEIANWPGITGRQLFALNVRHELRWNRVRKALDGAVNRRADHPDFLAYHNGLTVICDNFERQDDTLVIHNPSVVNGAQSVFAFRRGAESGILSEALRVFVKVVEVDGRPLLEKEVGRRSNTQTGVNPRNLMANHGTQLRLAREFANSYDDITYETRPDVLPETGLAIKNDGAAQLLCAIFNEWPWLAIKKTALFEADNHAQIFSERIHAHHVLFAERVKEAVQDQRSEFPFPYLSSWLLTRLVACYLVGQILRESQMVPDLLAASREVLEDPALVKTLRELAFLAAFTLCERNETLGEADDFKKDFKNQKKLLTLAAASRKSYRMYAKLKG